MRPQGQPYLALFVISLFLLPGFAGSASAATEWHADDFSSSTLTSWDILSESWALENGQLSVTTGRGLEGWAYEKTTPVSRSFRMEVDVAFMVTPGDDVGKHGGIMLSLNRAARDESHNAPPGDGTGYTIDWIDRPSEHGYRMARMDSGEHVATNKFPRQENLQPGRFYRWAVDVHPEFVAFYVDGAFIGRFDDAAHQGPFWIGLWAYRNGQHIHFDNLRVTALEATSRPLPLRPVPEGAPGFTGNLEELGAPLPAEGGHFVVDMADMAHKSHLRQPSDYKLILNAAVQADEPQGWIPDERETVADVWWNNVGPFQLDATAFAFAPGGHFLTLETVSIPAAYVHEGRNLVSVVPRHEQGEPMWNLTLRDARMELAAEPVMILHGWSPDMHWSGPPSPASWAPVVEAGLRSHAMAAYGQDPWQWAEGSGGGFWSLGYDPKQDVARSANDLRHLILDAQRTLGYDGKVAVFAHSLGGLVAREFVEVRAGFDYVDKVITVGTPHEGAKLASFMAALVEKAWRQEGASHFYEDRNGNGLYKTEEGSTRNGWGDWYALGAHREYDEHEMMADFQLFRLEDNKYLQNLPFAETDATYLLLAGRGDSFFKRDGDGIVSVESATLSGTSDACWRVHEFENYLTHHLLPEDTRFHRDAMLYATQGPRASICGGTAATAVTTLSSSQHGAKERPVTVSLVGGADDPAATYMVRLENATQAEFSVHALADEVSTSLSVVAPSGAEITPANVADFGGAYHEELGGSFAVQRLVVPSPGNGTWTVRAAATNATPAEKVAVIFEVRYDSPAHLSRLSQIQTHLVAQEAPVVVRLASDAGPIVDARVTLDVLDSATGAATRIVLLDDGMHGDGDEDDGVYGGSYRGMSSGEHPAVVSAEGALDGLAFYETLSTGFMFGHPGEHACREGLLQPSGGALTALIPCAEALIKNAIAS